MSQRLLREVQLGGAQFDRVVLTRNRRVMASVADSGRTLRLHECFLDAPADTLRAIGELFHARSARKRSDARDRIRSYLKDASAAGHFPPRTHHPRPRSISEADQPFINRLEREFGIVNAVHFGARLPKVPLFLSGRMRRRNGHFTPQPLEIVISRRLCFGTEPGEAERTLRHEMIHLWQWTVGAKIGHGADFRRWARVLGIVPRATRGVGIPDP